MLVSILNTIFSVPYLVIGFTLAALFDIGIYYTKVTSRFTLLEIWGCVMFWPIVLFIAIVTFIFGQEKE